MALTIMVTLEDSQVKNLLASSEIAGEPLDQHIASKLDELSSSVRTDSALLEIALKRVMEMSDGTLFTLKEVMSDVWDQIESPKSFGRLFKQKSSYYAAYEGVNPSNKATYRRYTISSPSYISEQHQTTIPPVTW